MNLCHIFKEINVLWDNNITHTHTYIYINVEKYEFVNVILMVDQSGGESICVDWRGRGSWSEFTRGNVLQLLLCHSSQTSLMFANWWWFDDYITFV